MYRCMHAENCTNACMHTQRDTDACMDGCTHNYYKLILFRFMHASFCWRGIARAVREKESAMTGYRCCVCGNSHDPGVSFHRIPKEPEWRALWL